MQSVSDFLFADLHSWSKVDVTLNEMSATTHVRRKYDDEFFYVLSFAFFFACFNLIHT